MITEDRINKIISKLQQIEKIDKQEMKIAIAPGRINLIGEHTDYNEGFVLPCAISKEIIMAATPSNNQKMKVCSLNYDEVLQFSLDDKNLTGTWIDYLKGVIQYLKEGGHKFKGFTGVLHSSVPIGGGLSSSAALEVVTAYTFKLLYDLKIDLKELALICFKAERFYMNISCGIMDQFISSLGKKNSFLYLDCRPPYNFEIIKLPREDIKMVILDTKIHRPASSVVNIRREECYKGVEIIQKETKGKISSLRDVSTELFEKNKKFLSQPIQNRCKHVIYENQRVIDAIKAIKKGDFLHLGELLYESHYSLDKLYEVSCEELNTMVESAKEIDGVIGARMTGAGLGGCACCLCYDWAVEELINKVKIKYEKKHSIIPEIYMCNINNGVREYKF